MNDPVIALIGAVVLAFLVRFFNVILEWLARVLAVSAPEPIAVERPDSLALAPRTPVAAAEDASAPSVPPFDTEGPTT